jgi:hypothetical protein
MCGIFGIINSLNTVKVNNTNAYSAAYLKNAEEFINDAIVASGVRGLHATGVFGMRVGATSHWHKKAVTGGEFLASKAAQDVVKEGATGMGIIGHVRHATTSAADCDFSAHPFCAERKDGDSIVGVHNGTIYGWDNEPDAKEFNVDSEWALNRIAKDGHKALDDLYGAFAFVWWDSADPTAVYMARNDERPLHFVMTRDGRHMLYASEPMMLAWLANRNKIDIADEVYEVPEGAVYRIDCRNHQLDLEKVYEFTSWSVSNYYRSSGRPASTKNPTYYDYMDGDWGDYRSSYDDSAVRKGIVDSIKRRAELFAETQTLDNEQSAEDDDFQYNYADLFPEIPAGRYAEDHSYSTALAAPYQKEKARTLGLLGRIVNFHIQNVRASELDGMVYLPEYDDTDSPYFFANMIGAYSAYNGANPGDMPDRYGIGVVIGMDKDAELDEDVVIVTPLFASPFDKLMKEFEAA